MSWIPIALSVGSALLGKKKKQEAAQLPAFQPYQPPLVDEPDIEEYMRRMRALREKLQQDTNPQDAAL